MTRLGPSYAVFCDVDQTLIGVKSMLDFLDYYFVEHAQDADCGARKLRCEAELHALRARGAPRAELNRVYYRVYAGQSIARVRALGERWFQERESGGGLFIPTTREALAQHRAQGAKLVLVSGSFAALLDPIARAVFADSVLHTRLRSDDGATYSGEIECPLIGEEKGTAVRRWLAGRPEIDPQRCYAYGDHASDIPMFECVGEPCAVGDDPVLLAYVAERRARPSLQP